MAPEAKLAALKRTRDLVRGNAWLRGLSLFAPVITVFAISRIVKDTTWTAWPRVFIADATLATISWTALRCARQSISEALAARIVLSEGLRPSDSPYTLSRYRSLASPVFGIEPIWVYEIASIER